MSCSIFVKQDESVEEEGKKQQQQQQKHRHSQNRHNSLTEKTTLAVHHTLPYT